MAIAATLRSTDSGWWMVFTIHARPRHPPLATISRLLHLLSHAIHVYFTIVCYTLPATTGKVAAAPCNRRVDLLSRER